MRMGVFMATKVWVVSTLCLLALGCSGVGEVEPVQVTRTTKTLCVIDRTEPSGPETKETFTVPPDTPEALAGDVEVVQYEGFCEKHLAEVVTLERTATRVCPVCDSENEVMATETSEVPRSALPAGYTTEDHALYHVDERIEDPEQCTSKLCQCMVAGATEQECKGAWKVEVETDPLDDSKIVTLSLAASDTFTDSWLNQTHRAEMLLICRNSKTELIFHNGNPPDVTETMYNFIYTEIAFRFDDGPVKRLRVHQGSDPTYLHVGNAVTHIKSMLQADSLRYQFTPVASQPVTMTFDLRGLESNIEPLREACGW